MKITIPLTFDIDPAAWAAEYGLDTTEAAVADVTGVLTRAATDGDLTSAIAARWPMMREYSVTAGAPGTVLAAIDWDHKVAATEVRNLMEHGHGADALTVALNDARQDDTVLDILGLVRAYIADNYGPESADFDPDEPAPVAVLFEADEWDNGYFLSAYATVYFADGTTEDSVDFGVGDQLTDAYGTVGPHFGLVIDLRTGDINADDNVDVPFLGAQLGLPTGSEVSA